MNLADKKSILDLVTDGKEIKVDLTLERDTKDTLIGTAIILSLGAIFTAIILTNKK